MPMHPCGPYRFNSLENVLKLDPLHVGQHSPLHLVHRLDRVTSGLVVLAKSKDAATAIGVGIRENTCQKVYFARVKGRFPNESGGMAHLQGV
jgi:tRNA pseudouridine synthase 9